MTKLFGLVVAVALAIGSFAFARYQYVEKNTTNIGGVIKINAADKDLFGRWVKHEPVFAIIVPLALIGGGVVLFVKK